MTADDAELAAVTRHARETVFPATPGRRCIDDRYEPGQGSGMIARAGADFGYVMALLALNHAKSWGLTPAQVVDAVIDAITKGGEPFRLHTDHRAPWPPFADAGRPPNVGTGQPTIGCWHIAAALDPAHAGPYFPPSYEAPAADVRAALARIADRAAAGAPVEVVTLRGDHGHGGLLVIAGTRRTVHPTSGRASYFVYDQTRDETFIAESLAPRLDIPKLSPEELVAAARVQLAATLRAAAPDRPAFLVDVDGAEPAITLAGPIEAVFPPNGPEQSS
jgi:hypothetical protein